MSKAFHSRSLSPCCLERCFIILLLFPSSLEMIILQTCDGCYCHLSLSCFGAFLLFLHGSFLLEVTSSNCQSSRCCRFRVGPTCKPSKIYVCFSTGKRAQHYITACVYAFPAISTTAVTDSLEVYVGIQTWLPCFGLGKLIWNVKNWHEIRHQPLVMTKGVHERYMRATDRNPELTIVSFRWPCAGLQATRTQVVRMCSCQSISRKWGRGVTRQVTEWRGRDSIGLTIAVFLIKPLGVINRAAESLLPWACVMWVRVDLCELCIWHV